MTRYAVPCPQSPDHGPLLDWNSPRWGWYCSHVRHVGRPFYTTDEAVPASTSAARPVRASVAAAGQSRSSDGRGRRGAG